MRGNMPKYDSIIQGGRVLDPANKTDASLDVGIKGGRIVEVAPELDPLDSEYLIDASGKWVMPGVIDTHVHVSVSRGRRSIALGHRQMAEAGVTTAIDFAGTMRGVIEGIRIGGAGLNVGGLYVLAPGSTIGSDDPSKDDLKDALAKALKGGSLGFKCIGGHHPMTPLYLAASELTVTRLVLIIWYGVLFCWHMFSKSPCFLLAESVAGPHSLSITLKSL